MVVAIKQFDEDKKLLVNYVEQLDEEKVIELANQLLDDGIDPLYLLELLNEGMNRVGRLYESKDYYIADLIMAGLIFKQVLDLDKVSAHFNGRHNHKIGKVLLGTVKGDIHDLGKDILRGMLEANGFDVFDLGVDVPKENFVKKVQEYKPDIVGLSGVLTSTVDSMKETINALKEGGLPEKTKFIVGGSHLTEDTCKYIGADGFANDTSKGVKICREWMKCDDGRGVNDD